MALATWDPYREMEIMRREMERRFSDFGRSFGDPRGARLFARGYPLINLRETADEIEVDALAPGLDPQSLKVDIVRDKLHIEGEKPAQPENESRTYHRNERLSGRFTRVIGLPAPVEVEKIEAQYRDGVLKIRLPKAQEAKPRRIEVNVG